MQITPYHDIDKLLRSLLYQMQRVLDKNLIGLYLYGSLVSGDFDLEISDIDTLAVTSSDIDDEEFEQLRKMHNDFVAKNPNWDGRIEIQYLSAVVNPSDWTPTIVQVKWSPRKGNSHYVETQNVCTEV
jgi:predicted nucleotidyltransferase